MEAVANVRNDMYLTSEAIKFLEKDSSVKFDADTKANLKAFKKDIDDATKFIPLWVKVTVAIALGLGTMVGWKRIVVTVGEKIGKSPDLCAGSIGGTGGHDDYWSGRYVRPAGFHHSSPVFGRSRRHDRQQIGPAVEYRPEFGYGMGIDATCRNAPFRITLLAVYQAVLMRASGVPMNKYS